MIFHALYHPIEEKPMRVRILIDEGCRVDLTEMVVSDPELELVEYSALEPRAFRPLTARPDVFPSSVMLLHKCAFHR